MSYKEGDVCDITRSNISPEMAEAFFVNLWYGMNFKYNELWEEGQ